jgi:NAD(P)-dependent dehydrogenase (short-subunit alcohol dehydrogenase family)
MPDQSGRVVIITGANSGIGYESAVAFARKGARVVMACRNLEKAERARRDLLKATPGADVEIMALDLGSLKSVHSFAESFNANYGQLDILMNNAGIMAPPYGKTVDGFETQFGTNHLGHFALTGLLIPKLLETPHSRVVTVSSGVYLNAHIDFNDLQSEKRYNPWAAYSQSKLANILFMRELQHKLDAARAGVMSVASHPGWAATNLQASDNRLQHLFMQTGNFLMAQSAERGAVSQLYAATAPNVHGGEFYGPRLMLWGDVVRVELNVQGKDLAKATRLWHVSEQLTGVYDDVLGQPTLVLA